MLAARSWKQHNIQPFAKGQDVDAGGSTWCCGQNHKRRARERAWTDFAYTSLLGCREYAIAMYCAARLNARRITSSAACSPSDVSS